MQNLKIKYIRAKNFMCFDEIEIDFTQYGNIVVIKAINSDICEKTSSNGVGKSAIADIITYGFYGKVARPKKIKVGDVVNKKKGKNLEVEIRWDNYRILRKRSPDGLNIWQSSEGIWDEQTDISEAGHVQEQIESIIKLNYEAFVNIFIFADDNSSCFLEVDTEARREIVENLMALDVYRQYGERAKEQSKDIKTQLITLTKEYEFLAKDIESSKKYIIDIENQEKAWKIKRTKELENYKTLLASKTAELNKSDIGVLYNKYNEAQNTIKTHKSDLEALEAKEKNFSAILLDAFNKKEAVDKTYFKLESDLKSSKEKIGIYTKYLNDNKKIVDDILKKDNKDCPYCLSKIDISKFKSITDEANNKIVEYQSKLEAENTIYESIKANYDKEVDSKKTIDTAINGLNSNLSKIKSKITNIQIEISSLASIKEPDLDLHQTTLKAEIKSIEDQIALRNKDETSPYEVIKLKSNTELENKIKNKDIKKLEIAELEDTQLYYDFWIKAFGDKGIRKFVVDGIIDPLNEQIEYWLKVLVDGNLSIKFNSEFKAEIDRYPFLGKDYVYALLSGGQRRKSNLSIVNAFAYIRMLNYGVSTSAIFLDEVAINLDEHSLHGVYKMICELAKDKQVFVIDHNPLLLAMLQGCDTITLRMENGITKKIA